MPRLTRISTRRGHVAFATAVVAIVVPSGAAAQVATRTAVAPASAVLELDGQPIPLVNVRGPEVVAHVLSTRSPGGSFTKKHVADLRIEPLVAEVSVGDKAMMEWIAATWAGQRQPKDVSVTTHDVASKSSTTKQLSGAVIAQTTVPTLDVASREAPRFGVVIVPEHVRAGPAGAAAAALRQRSVMPGTFRFELAGLPTKAVRRIESFQVATARDSDPIGVFREASAAAGSIDFPNLTVIIGGADVAAWRAWHQQFLIDGARADSDEKNGAIELLDAGGKQVVARIALTGCGIVSLMPEGMIDAGSPWWKAELYCERMALTTP